MTYGVKPGLPIKPTGLDRSAFYQFSVIVVGNRGGVKYGFVKRQGRTTRQESDGILNYKNPANPRTSIVTLSVCRVNYPDCFFCTIAFNKQNTLTTNPIEIS